MREQFEEELLLLIEKGNLQFQQLAEMAERRPEPSEERSALAREWWMTSAQTLRAFTALVGVGDDREFVPVSLLGTMARISESLAGGTIPPPVTDAKRKGALSLGEREAIAVAIRYHEAVSSGEVQDKRPTSRICELYKVKRQTLQKWLKEREARLAGLHQRRMTADLFQEELRRAGEAYRKWGYYGSDKT